MVVDDLSRKGRSVGSLSFIQVVEKTLGIDAQGLSNRFVIFLSITEFSLVWLHSHPCLIALSSSV